MKTISIGSSRGCNIFINDETVSKQHALILISKWGKLHIVNLGESGTTVNGVRIRSRVPIPLKRGNAVCIGCVYYLDWGLIPNPRKKYAFVIGSILTALALLMGGIIICSQRNAGPLSDIPQPTPPASPSVVSITGNNDKEQDKDTEKNQTEQDSILSPQQLWERSGKKIPEEYSVRKTHQKETPHQEQTANPVQDDEKGKIDSIVGEDVPLDIEIEITEEIEDTMSIINNVTNN